MATPRPASPTPLGIGGSNRRRRGRRDEIPAQGARDGGERASLFDLEGAPHNGTPTKRQPPDAPFGASGGCFLYAVRKGKSPSRSAYFEIALTTPAPTVRPPSRIVKRWPTSIAIGAISLMPSATLSPGITISVPSGSSTVPVTSVVRK